MMQWVSEPNGTELLKNKMGDGANAYEEYKREWHK